MKTKIAVVCALPPERNTGMVTVDLAAHRFFERFADRAEVRLYSYGAATPYGYRPGELPFQHLNIAEYVPEYLASDLFVFWGDFIHSRSYQQFDLGAWDVGGKGGAKPAAAARLEQYRRFMFLSGSPETVLHRSVLFGSTVITNHAGDDLDADYKAGFDRLFATLGGVFLRDALSTAKVAPLRGGAATQGCDCAFLLRDDDLAALPDFQMAPARSGVGVFFGRSPRKATMLAFSRLFGQALGEECRWIPWFWSGRRVRWPARAFGYDVPAGHASPGALLSQLSACRFVVTDTYHVCVNAWRLGIPAICLGAGASASIHSLADKKKEVLFEMYGARAFYIFLETLSSPRALLRAARRAAAAVQNQALTEQVCANLGEHRRMAEQGLVAAVERSLAGVQMARRAG